MKRLLLFAGILGILLVPRPAAAAMIQGATLVATGGAVTAEFMGHTAGFTNELYLFADDLTTLLYPGVIFNNHTTPVGTQVNLGTFAAGTELVFAIRVLNTGDLFFMGAGSRNSDGLTHAAVDDGLLPQFPDYGAPIPAGFVGVGFEDIFGPGFPQGISDRDFDDLGYAFNSVRVVRSAPEPVSLSLFAIGLAGMGARRMRQRRG
jgi:hypothetical protein